MHKNKQAFLYERTYGKIIGPLTIKLSPFLVKHHVTPNMITFVNLMIGYIAAISIILENHFIGALLFCITICIDGMDGTYARLTNQVSDRGAIMDSMVDLVTMQIVFISISASIHLIALYGLTVYPLNLLFWKWRYRQYSSYGQNVDCRVTYRSYFVSVTAEKTFLAIAIILHVWVEFILPIYIMMYYSCVVLRMMIHYRRTRRMLNIENA